MINNPDYKAIEQALAGESDETLSQADRDKLRQLAKEAAVGVSDGFLDSARRLLLVYRQETLQREQMESIMPAVRQIWPKAEFTSCIGFLCIHKDGLPSEPEIDQPAARESL